MPYGNDRLDCFWSKTAEALQRLCIPYTNSLFDLLKREPVHRVFSHIQRTHITVMRRWHSISSLIPHRHSQTHSQRRCLGHTSFFIHRDRRVYSVPRFQPGIDPFIVHPSRNGKMPVYRAPCICLPTHRETTTSMAQGSPAKPPHPSFFGRAKRRTSSRYKSKGRSHTLLYNILKYFLQCKTTLQK